MLVDFLLLMDKESPDLLNSSVLHESVGVFKFGSVLWVVPHEVLSQENTWVESVLDGIVDLSFL